MITAIATVTVTIITGNIGAARVTVVLVIAEIDSIVTVVEIGAIATVTDIEAFAMVIEAVVIDNVGIDKEICHAQT
jgi:hypothetical protein